MSAKKQRGTKKKKKNPKKDQMPPRAVLEPEYAVGKGLISQDEFDARKNEFFSQSELSIGLILPLVLLASAVSYWLSGLVSTISLALLVAILSGLLYFAGVERRFQYRFELKILILGRWDAAMDAKAKANASSGPSAKTKIEEKLSIELKPLAVDFRTGSVEAKPPAHAPGLADSKS